MGTSAGLFYLPIQVVAGDNITVTGTGYPYVVSGEDPELPIEIVAGENVMVAGSGHPYVVSAADPPAPIQVTAGDRVSVTGTGFPYVVSAAPSTRIDRAVGTTNASGLVTVVWTPAFAGPPNISLSLQGSAGFRTARVTANSATSTTIEVVQSVGVTLLGIGVLAAAGPASGIPVMITAVQPPGV